MAKKKATGALGPGTRIRIKDNVAAPEFPDVSCSGWTGTVVDVSGKKDPKYVIEWDESVIESFPAGYVERCEQNNLFYRMAAFEAADIEPAAD